MVTKEQWERMGRSSGATVVRALCGWVLPCIVSLRHKDGEVIEAYIKVETDRFFYGFGESGVKQRWYKDEWEFIRLVL